MRESRLFINPTLSPQTSDEFPQTFGINLIGGTEPCQQLEELNSARQILSITYFTARVKRGHLATIRGDVKLLV
jgi:hypothetical protein